MGIKRYESEVFETELLTFPGRHHADRLDSMTTSYQAMEFGHR